MTCDDSAFDDSSSDDFQRWYFGGSPPESDGWERHAFESALQGAPVFATREPMPAPPPQACDFGRDVREPMAVA